MPASYVPGPWDQTALSRAVVDQLAGRTRVLLALGADPNVRITQGGADWTPLGLAIKGGATAVAGLIVGNGARVDARWCVPVEGRYEKVEHREAYDGCTIERGITPLMFSAAELNADMVRLLLSSEADALAVDWRGWSAREYVADAEKKARDTPSRTRAVDIKMQLSRSLSAQKSLSRSPLGDARKHR